MAGNYFTLKEANALLPQIEPLVGQLLEKRARASQLSYRMPGIVNDLRSDVGGPVATEVTQLFAEIEQLLARIQAYGCVVKNVNVGLIDFLADYNGRDIYLCWQYGEPQIAFYHDLHTGYNGRQSVDTLNW